MSTSTQTIKEFLEGSILTPMDENTILSVLVGRGVSETTLSSEVETSLREILVADILMIIATTITSYSQTNRTGDWQVSISGTSLGFTERKQMRAFAQSIYKKYNVFDSIEEVKSAINI